MKRFRLMSFFIASFAGLTMLLGMGPGHGLLSQPSMAHDAKTGETAKHCQAVCPPLLGENQKTPGVQEDDADPDPLPFATLPTERFIALTYLVAFLALAWLLLQRRPPDLVIQYSNFRF